MRGRTRSVAWVIGCCALASWLGGCTSINSCLNRGLEHELARMGPRKVRGADPATDGPRIYEKLKKDGKLADFLAKHPEPDSIEVLGRRCRPKSYVFMFRDASSSYCVTVRTSSEGLVPSARHNCQKTPAPLPKKPKPQPKPQPKPKPKPQPQPKKAEPAAPAKASPEQELECPIEQKRPDCVQLCKSNPSYSWCR